MELPKRKKTRHIALSAMRGRKSDTKLMLFVIILVFLFISLSQILLASIAETDHVRRTDLYGTWQVMYHGAKENKVKALREEMAGTSLSVLPIAAYTRDNTLIASFDDRTMELGSFKLKEGRLPEAPDEIALVGSGDDAEKVIGSTVTMKYYSDHTLKHFTASESLADKYAHLYPYLPFNDLRIVRDFEHWWTERKGNPGILGYETYPDNLSEFTALQYRSLFAQWMRRSYWFEQYGPATESNELISYEGLTISIQRLFRTVNYVGWDSYDENGDTGFKGYAKPWFTKVEFNKDYKVTGLIEPYEERWDTEGYEMPSGFVTPEECRFIHNALDAPREKFSELPPYEPQSIVLVAGSPPMAASLYEQGLPVYEDGLTQRFKISKLQKGFGKYGGYITGLDRRGNEISMPYEGEGGLLKIEDRFRYGEAFYATVEQLQAGTFSSESIFPMPAPKLSADKAYESNEEPYRINRYAYPPEKDIAVQLQAVMSLSLSAVSFCAVFLISLTQLRRRSKRIALTRAIGASKGQTVKLLAWETWYQLIVGVPLGFLIGLILSFLAVKIFGSSYSVGMVFSVDVGALLLGLLGGVISVLISMTLSGLYAMQIPLISGAEKAPKKLRVKPRARQRKRKKMTRLSLVRREISFNRGRSAAAFALSFLLILSSILAVFLGSNAFARWRETVYLPDKPDYVIRVPYSVNKPFLKEIMEEIDAIADVRRVVPYHAGENLSLVCEKLLTESPRLKLEYEKNPPEQPGSAFSLTGGVKEALNYYKEDIYREQGMSQYDDPDQDDGSDAHKGQDVTSVFVDLLCFDFDLYPTAKDLLKEALAEGDVDWERLSKGETCLVLSPLYDDELRSSTIRNDRHLFYRDEGVDAGDIFELKGHTQSVSEDNGDVITREKEVEVSGIIHYFPDRGLWPLSDEPKRLVLISGEPLLRSLYHLSGKRMDPYQSSLFETMSKLFQPDCMGKSYFCLYADHKAEGGMLDIAVHQWSASRGFHVIDYRMANRSLYTDAQSSMLMTVLLAAGVVFITFTILVNTNQSTVDANKKRTGILQAVGLTKQDLLAMQIYKALPAALLALLLAHAFVASALAIISVFFEGVSPQVLIPHMAETYFWQYPWAIHAGLCVLFVVLSVAIAVNPMRKVASESAIDNIRD